jgi:hypothetical protein
MIAIIIASVFLAAVIYGAWRARKSYVAHEDAYAEWYMRMEDRADRYMRR